MAPRANWKGGSTEQLQRDIDSGRTGALTAWSGAGRMMDMGVNLTDADAVSRSTPL
jgi:hypothetical protein